MSETQQPPGEDLLADLRGDIRHWRRGRATARIGDVLEDLYVAAFSTLVLGSMVVNVVVNVGRISDQLCTSTGCREARSLLPWAALAVLLLLTLLLARLFGPVYVTPASGSWLVPAPLDRAALLRPRLLAWAAAALVVDLVLAGVAAVLAGFGAGSLVNAGLAGSLGLAAVALTALGQPGRGRLAAVLPWVLGGLLLVVLGLMAGGNAPLLADPAPTWGWAAAIALVALLGVVSTVVVVRRLGSFRHRDVAPGGVLAPSLSGALASLDLALAYDVLVAHRWHDHEAVRPRRGGGGGAWALVWLDLVRLWRTPRAVLVVAAAAVVGYAAAGVGAGRLGALLAGLAGFLALLPLLGGLRVLTRTPGLARLLPFPSTTARAAALVVPGVLAVLAGLADAPALARGLELDGPTAVRAGIAVGLAALASATRWVTGRPPNYERPLVSSPMGAVPTNLYGSVFRGFDVLLLTTAPLLLAPNATGALVSAVLAAVVLAYFVGRT